MVGERLGEAAFDAHVDGLRDRVRLRKMSEKEKAELLSGLEKQRAKEKQKLMAGGSQPGSGEAGGSAASIRYVKYIASDMALGLVKQEEIALWTGVEGHGSIPSGDGTNGYYLYHEYGVHPPWVRDPPWERDPSWVWIL